jgi:hypothetical protein
MAERAALLRPVARDDEAVALLRELVAEVRELRAAVAPELAQRVAVLAALHGAFGGEAFTALDALERAAEEPLGECAKALVPLLGAPLGGLRRLARRLAKLAGKAAGGLVLTRVGDDRGAYLYVIEAAQ